MAGTPSYLLGALLLVGCGFTATPTEEDMDNPDDPAPPEPGEPAARKCATGDASLRLCIDFEDTTTLAGDGSGRNHHPVIADSLTAMSRDAETAIQMSTQSRLQIAEHADFDITTNLTVSMWMNTTSLPSSGAFWMLDNNKQYAMSLQPDGQFRCGLGSDTVDSVASLVELGSGWHHVACTYDGGKLKVFVDGWVAGCKDVNRPIAIDGTEGIAIGSNVNAGPVFSEHYVGGLDNVQVFARTWSPAELCAANGGGFCNSSCVGSGVNPSDD